MKARWLIAGRLVVGLGMVLPGASAWLCADETPDVATLLERIGVRRGVCMVLADPKAELALKLARNSELLVYLQLAGDEDVQAARQAAVEAGLFGRRLFVAKGPLKRLHLADNLADAVVAPMADAAPKAEILRVLRPGGKAILGDVEFVKPVPEGIDEWTHPYHGPDNNPQSTDRLARAPYLTQFIAEPWYVPQPEVSVAAGGRIFKAFGHITSKPREWPWLDKLVAVSAYNGSILWQRDLKKGFMIHRNTMIATAETLYLADDESCKLIDAATGKVRGEIVAPKELCGGTVWKWMALEDGVLYALIGGEEQAAQDLRLSNRGHGWWWGALGKGYAMQDFPWGFGRTILAIDPVTRKVLWHHGESEPLDGRATCMKGGRIYTYSHGKFLTCLDAATGKVAWKSSAPAVLGAIGQHLKAQTASLGYSSSAYMKCSEKALYFAGPTRSKLVAVSAEDGSLLWTWRDGNMQLVLRNDGLYAMARTGSNCMKFDPLTGKVLADFRFRRGNCTRATGSIDSVFVRGGGTVRLDTAAGELQRISPMRPPCQDGVMISNGLLHWGPWMCDCNLSLVGSVSLAPAGNFEFSASKPPLSSRLETTGARPTGGIETGPNDWPTYRADNGRSASSKAEVAGSVELLWKHEPPAPAEATAPVAAGGLVFVAGSDGVVRALDGATGKLRWRACTGGAVLFPPTIADGRALVGSSDGSIYAFDATGGALLWRFRAAPIERRIPVGGLIRSTWPIASGVLVADGVAYAAAGITSYDGTGVYALEAATGKLIWENNTSGLLNKEWGIGVSVQGHLLLHDGKLYLAGGNAVSPAVYDAKTGRCLNQVNQRKQAAGGYQELYRGRDLYQMGDRVVPSNHVLYAPHADLDWPTTWAWNVMFARRGGVVVCQTNKRKATIARAVGSFGPSGNPKAAWEQPVLAKTLGIVVTPNAAVAVGVADVGKPSYEVVAMDVETGKGLWKQQLPGGPVPWGIAVDRDGRVIVTCRDGSVLCYGASTDN